MAKHRNGDERRQLPPHIHLKKADRGGERCRKRHEKRQADQRHHARTTVGKFDPRAAKKDATAVHKNDGTEDRGNPSRPGKCRRRVAQPVLDLARPNDHRNRERQAQPGCMACPSCAAWGRSGIA